MTQQSPAVFTSGCQVDGKIGSLQGVDTVYGRVIQVKKRVGLCNGMHRYVLSDL